MMKTYSYRMVPENLVNLSNDPISERFLYFFQKPIDKCTHCIYTVLIKQVQYIYSEYTEVKK